MIPTHYILLSVAVLVLLSVLASKASERLGVPALLMFLLIGMVAGSEGPGGVYFDDAAVAKFVGTLALAFILFSGGLDTNWQMIRPVLGPGIVLSTVGVVLTAAAVGLFAVPVLGFSIQEGLLRARSCPLRMRPPSSRCCAHAGSALRAGSNPCWNSNPAATTRWRSS